MRTAARFEAGRAEARGWRASERALAPGTV